MLSNIDKSYFNKGVFVFENGDYIFIEEIQYSYDTSYWEDTFQPETHIDPRNTAATIPGHRYRRVRHAGDDYFQQPEYIVAEDGKTPLFTIMNEGIYMKYEGESDDSYTLLTSLDSITGPQGEQGDRGTGWEIDSAGYWLEKPECSSALTATSTCVPCNRLASAVSSSSNGIYLFLSLGDGLRTMESGDIGLYRSSDGTSWIEIVASDVGNTTRWVANDAIGTGAVDYRDQDTLGTKGKVYYCDGESWNLLFNVAVPRHQVSPTAAYYAMYQSGFFMEDYVTTPLNTNPIYDTIALTTDFKLVVRKDTLEPAHFKDGSFGDGLNEGTAHATEGIKMNTIVFQASDVVGFGTRSYLSATDSYYDIQVYAPDLAGNGLSAYDDSSHQADGESRWLFQVNPASLVDASLSGLTTFTNTDGFLDFKVNPYNGLIIDTNGLNVYSDDLSISFDSSKKVQVKPYAADNDGILANHLNPNVADTDKGIVVSNTDGIGIDLLSSNSGLAFSSGDLTVGSHAIEGIHLHSNIADNNKGIKMDTTTDLLEVLLHSGGGLTFDSISGGVKIDTSDLSWLSSEVVNKIQVGTNDLTGDILLQGDTSSDTIMYIEVSNVGNTITITPSTQLGALNDAIDARIASGPASHTHSISDVSLLQAALDAKVDEDTDYLRTKIATGSGLEITSTGGNTYRLDVDDSGNLFTTLIP